MKNESTPLLMADAEAEAKKEKDNLLYNPTLSDSKRKRSTQYMLVGDSEGVQDIVDNNQMLYKLLEVAGNDQTFFEGALEKVSQWGFDPITFNLMVGEQGFIILGLKVISACVSVKTLGIPTKPLIDLLKEVRSPVLHPGL
jgi:hypothetical protein